MFLSPLSAVSSLTARKKFNLNLDFLSAMPVSQKKERKEKTV